MKILEFEEPSMGAEGAWALASSAATALKRGSIGVGCCGWVAGGCHGDHALSTSDTSGRRWRVETRARGDLWTVCVSAHSWRSPLLIWSESW